MSRDPTSPPEPLRDRILVLDDETEIRQMLQRYLIAQGFEVRAVKDGMQLDACLERQPYDLLVLDIMMPKEDGLAVCRRLRAQGQTIPILMLTARGDPVDRVMGLEMGADDYLAKPFVPSELVARIRAMLRRRTLLLRQAGQLGGIVADADAPALRFGPYRLDVRRQELFRDASLLEIGSAEMRLLCALASAPNRPQSRDSLLERARGREYGALLRSVDVQVLRLRQMLEDDASKPRHIRTVWGVGYMLIAEYEAS
ncbi:response regulator [Burkholderia plantarii]|nr:response regulator [Burkholderia plantarii]ALK32916.1 two component transcriptional regulator, winged helix family protein [Burkholderia plantarii]WLE61986.1 response regulator [Burkholderia plantarii]GLZ20338.1 DNA-binding response regulator [Burkholderia plantarii]